MKTVSYHALMRSRELTDKYDEGAVLAGSVCNSKRTSLSVTPRTAAAILSGGDLP
jgi:hypothetical protein